MSDSGPVERKGVSSGASGEAGRSSPDVPPVTLEEVLSEVGDEFLSLDRGLPGTMLALCLRPARVARAYLFERDRRYVRPLRYLLLSIALGLLASWIVLDKLGMRASLGASERALQQSSFLLEHAALLTLLVLPLVAGAMRLLFHGLKLRYLDALVLLAYTQAQVNLLSLLALGWLVLAGDNDGQGVLGLVAAVYLVWSWAGFAQGPAWRRWLAAVLSLVAGQLINAGVVSLVVKLAT